MSDYPNETAVRDACVDTNSYSVVHEQHECRGSEVKAGTGVPMTVEECMAQCDAKTECRFVEFAITKEGGRCNDDMTKCRCLLVLEDNCVRSGTPGQYVSLRKNVVKKIGASSHAQGRFGCWDGMQSNIGQQCWDGCGHNPGLCPKFCGANGMCCKPGGSVTDCTFAGVNSSHLCTSPSD